MYPNAVYIIKELINYIKENIVSICSNSEKLREIIKTRLKWRRFNLHNLQETCLATKDSLLMSSDLVKAPLRESVESTVGLLMSTVKM